MCGIFGFIASRIEHSEFKCIAKNMGHAIAHRGPDSSGDWMLPEVGLCLGHRRLAVLDTSEAGFQPMSSNSGRYTIVFNGEIYNHKKLRTLLKESLITEIRWRGHSDTETLLACFDSWGIKRTIESTVGMFSVAVWDGESEKLYLARDRLGEKPLYYGWQNENFIFSSELSALKYFPNFKPEIDRDALTQLLRYNYIPAPQSIYKGVFKLKPGEIAELSFTSAHSKKITTSSYWNLSKIVADGISDPFRGTAEQAVQALHDQLLTSVDDQTLSDVPIGAFLSGGIDSSTVVALMQEVTKEPVKTFTIGTKESGFDEAGYARTVAKHLKTDHHELYVSTSEALDVIPNLQKMYSEPFSDSSQIPTFLVSKLAKELVTVALSGDGGDELFGGYNRYLSARKVWNYNQKLPLVIRKVVASGLRTFSPDSWDRFYGLISQFLPKKYDISIPGEKAHKLAEILELKTGKEFYSRLTSQWNFPESVVLGSTNTSHFVNSVVAGVPIDQFEHWMMALDAQTYLPDDILVKVDRAAMACSLETRVPLLDHRVVELAWKMPLHYKIRGSDGKWLLKQVLRKYVPNTLIERPKMGFGVPLASWLRGALKDWVEDLLDEKRLENEGFFNPIPVRRMWEQHLSGRYNRQYHLWPIIMFQAWYEEERSALSLSR